MRVHWGEGRTSRCGVGKLPVETKTQELPLTAELNQNPGNLFMKHRKTARKHDFLSLLKNATYGKAHTLTIEIHFNCFCCSCDLSWFVLG